MYNDILKHFDGCYKFTVDAKNSYVVQQANLSPAN